METDEETTVFKAMSVKHKLCYPGDIKDDIIDQLSLSTKSTCIKLLKRACLKKDHAIKRLYAKQIRDKKKIINLEELLTELRQQCGLSSNASNIIQV